MAAAGRSRCLLAGVHFQTVSSGLKNGFVGQPGSTPRAAAGAGEHADAIAVCKMILTREYVHSGAGGGQISGRSFQRTGGPGSYAKNWN